MEPEQVDAIAQLPEAESCRDSFPETFPNPIDIPAARYTNPEFFSLEVESVFLDSWLFVAHASQLPEPGDYLALEGLERMGHPIFLVRGRDGRIRAFYNACRHRGGPLIDQPAGSTGRHLICKYHAWTYDLKGELVGYPEAKNFPDGMKQKCPPLAQVQCDSWGGLVFVKLTQGGPTLRAYLEPIATEVDSLIGDAATGAHFAEQRSIDIPCNWKLAGDGNIETYHVPFLHRNSAAAFLDEKRTGQWLLPNGHSRMLIRFRDDVPLPSTPVFEGDTRLAELGVYSFHIFPNLSLVFGGASASFLISAWPEGPDRSLYMTHFLSPVKRTDSTTNMIDASVEGNWNVLLEDLGALGPAQKAMDCGVTDVLRLQYQERRIRYVHEEIDRRIGPERVSAAMRVPALLDSYVEER